MGDKPICQCLQGFEPKNQNNLSQGCMRNSFVSCNDKEKDVFYLTTELKVPETKYTWASKSMKLDECNAKCISNCSCSAYGYNSNLDGSISDLAIGTECVLWFGDLFDTRNPKAPKETLVGSNGNSKVKKAVIIIAVILFIGLVLIGYYIYRRRCINVSMYSTMLYGTRIKELYGSCEIQMSLLVNSFHCYYCDSTHVLKALTERITHTNPLHRCYSFSRLCFQEGNLESVAVVIVDDDNIVVVHRLFVVLLVDFELLVAAPHLYYFYISLDFVYFAQSKIIFTIIRIVIVVDYYVLVHNPFCLDALFIASHMKIENTFRPMSTPLCWIGFD
ncbi:hypothetical protein F8388_012022 [Cannabis sativa]|uniref:Apple domain-containing protein n=1 Tax=Cannabis sativa TaxID=3483 RepID=A0A7J6GFQ7_CANSA|nr:hypothetical protein F8388_012022 [Cannabis sativa]